MRTVLRGLNVAITALLAVAVILGVVEVTSGRWQLRPVTSGSMRPVLPIGSVALVEREPTSSVAVGQIYLTHPPADPKATVIHRVVSMQPSPAGTIVQTKGDANPAPDPWQVRVTSSHVYRERFEVPVVGRVALAVHSPHGRRVLLVLAALLMMLAVGNEMAKLRRRSRRPRGGGRHAAGNDTAGDLSILDLSPST